MMGFVTGMAEYIIGKEVSFPESLKLEILCDKEVNFYQTTKS